MVNEVEKQISFADERIHETTAQLHAQCDVLFRLREAKLDTSALDALLESSRRELRQWEEYRTLLLIKKGMVNFGAA